MLKAIAHTKNGPILILGLSRRNCELLLKGRPIRIDPEDIRGGGPIIILLGCETEAELTEMIRSHVPNFPTDTPKPGAPVVWSRTTPKK